MYKIEFNDEMTISGILLSFNTLNQEGIESYIEIDGIKIYWNDINIEGRIKQEYIRYKKRRIYLVKL